MGSGLFSAGLHRIHAILSAVLIYILSLGPIPQHVGFVMDGNRRYAKGRGMQVTDGHTDGFQSLKRVSQPDYEEVMKSTNEPDMYDRYWKYALSSTSQRCRSTLLP
jgi:undecaprenyl pyrophosphate synthase